MSSFRYLHESGADIHYEDRFQRTPFHLVCVASEFGSNDVINTGAVELMKYIILSMGFDVFRDNVSHTL